MGNKPSLGDVITLPSPLLPPPRRLLLPLLLLLSAHLTTVVCLARAWPLQITTPD